MRLSRISYISIISFGLMASACQSDSNGFVPEEPASHAAIRLSASAAASSRALVGTKELTQSGSKFKVWGNYRRQDAPADFVSVFDAVDVTSDGSHWSYSDTQYWFPDLVYTFRAFYPASQAGVTFSAGTTSTEAAHLSLSHFDATSGSDILSASATVESAAAGNPTVAFNFRHLLARIDIKASVDAAAMTTGASFVVNSISFSGLSTEGSWDGTGFNGSSNLGQWKTADQSTSQYPVITPQKQLTGTPQSLLSAGDNIIFVIPQEIPTGARVEISYTDNDGTHNISADLYKATLSVGGRYEASRTYSYNFVIGPQQYILFDIPSVDNWTDAGGGNYIIQ